MERRAGLDQNMFRRRCKTTLPQARQKMKHKCTTCGGFYASEKNLSRHRQAVHMGQIPFKCQQCSQKFGYKHVLNLHSHTHTGAKPHKCGDCKKRFRTNTDLQTHKRIHSGDTPYTCKRCRKQFSDRSNLNRHNRVHTGAKPYRCQTCAQAFNQNANLTRHLKNVHRKKNNSRHRTGSVRGTLV